MPPRRSTSNRMPLVAAVSMDITDENAEAAVASVDSAAVPGGSVEAASGSLASGIDRPVIETPADSAATQAGGAAGNDSLGLSKLAPAAGTQPEAERQLHTTLRLEPGGDDDMHVAEAEQKGLLSSGNEDTTTIPASRTAAQGATLAQTYITFFKSFVGIAILGLPHAFSLAGYILAPLGFMLVCYVSFYCMRLLLACKTQLAASGQLLCLTDSAQGIGYQDVARFALGNRGQALTEFCLVTSQMGFLVGYLIFIGANAPPALHALGGPQVSPFACVLTVAFALIPLVCLRSIKKLSSSALLANIAILFGIGTVLVYDVQFDLKPHGDRGLVAFNWPKFPMYFGSAVFAMEGIALLLPVENAMAEPQRFPEVLRNSCIGLSLLLGGFATFCYLTFGDATEDLITLNLPPSDTVVVLMQLLYSLSLFFTYPLMIFPVTQILENTKCARFICGIPAPESASAMPCGTSATSSGTASGDEYAVLSTDDTDEVSADETDSSNNAGDVVWRQNAFRATCVLLTAVIAILVPQFNLISNSVGAFSCTFMAFLLPAKFHLVLFPEQSKYSKWKLYGIMVVGSLGGMIALVESLQAMATLLQ